MKIDLNLLHIPPYISTNWHNISALHMNGPTLHVTLIDGTIVPIPELSPLTIQTIFDARAAYVERDQSPEMNKSPIFPLSQFATKEQRIDIPFRVGVGAIDELGSIFQHNPSQSTAPEIPQEILYKIVSVAKIVAPDEMASFSKAEPHCNCVYCQIARAVHHDNGDLLQDIPILVSETRQELDEAEEDLSFQQWDITQSGDQLYAVTNRLDPQEKYNVYLGNPVGCTCGKQGCEHIIAVLKS